MKDQIVKLISKILEDMGISGVMPDVEVPEDPAHGDYTTNVAMKIATNSKLKTQNSKWRMPMDIALQVKERVESRKSKVESDSGDQNIVKHSHPISPKLPLSPILQVIERVDVAPPGFLNVFLTEASLITSLQRLLKSAEAAKTVKEFKSRVMVEFAHPNTHKAFHIGHLRNISTGESIIRLLESQGNEVIRANYQGDVGMHIAKALYGLLRISNIKNQISKIKTKDIKTKVEFLGKAYAAGSKAFEEDAAAKEEIVSLNALVYAAAQRLARERGIDPGTTDYLTFVKDEYKDRLETVYTLWKDTRAWSLDYFETIYKRVGSHYDRYYFESECLAGVDLANDARKKGVLKKDADAIIFDGKPYGIDTRVFVNRLGLPTYEGKELKLSTMETTEYGKLDRIIHVVGPEQASFFQVTFKAEERLGIVKPGVQHHLIYGWVKLKHGKMSSRSGNVVLGEWLLDEAKKSIYSILEKTPSKESSSISPRSPLSSAEKDDIAEKAAVAAVKYAFLRVGTTSEIAFDIEESVSFQGDSGPYLQYTYARCRSVLRKAQESGITNYELGSKGDSRETQVNNHNSYFIIPNSIGDAHGYKINVEERSIMRLLMYFPDTVASAAKDFAPSGLCSYLFRLAQSYNLFYAKHQILGNQEYGIRNQGKKKSTLLDSHDSYFMIHDSAKLRLSLTAATAQVLKNGLYLLGIETLEQM